MDNSSGGWFIRHRIVKETLIEMIEYHCNRWNVEHNDDDSDGK